MIDRYLNDELRESMSANQKDLIEKLMAQPYEERSIEERREMYEQYEKMLKERDEAESKVKEDEFTKMDESREAGQRIYFHQPYQRFGLSACEQHEERRKGKPRMDRKKT